MKMSNDEADKDSGAELKASEPKRLGKKWWDSLPPWVSGVAFVCHLQLFLALTGYCIGTDKSAFLILLSVTGIGLLVLWLARDENDPALMYLLPIGMMALLLLILS